LYCEQYNNAINQQMLRSLRQQRMLRSDLNMHELQF